MRKLVVAVAAIALLSSCEAGRAERLRVRLPDVGALRPGAPVVISGVRVGSVTALMDIVGSPGMKELTLEFPTPPPLPNDARARLVRTRSGDYYIDLDLAKTSGPPAQNGDLLPAADGRQPTTR